jgi:hypothetical protein
MPGEFVPRGYLLWLRTWLDDGRYIGPVLWSLDTNQIDMKSFPDRAFDSQEERDRVAGLIAKYNHTVPEEQEQSADDEDDDDDDESDEEEPQAGPADPDVEMTPEIDEQFAQIGRERVAHSPFRYYLVLPVKRGISLWFDTHSQYYPFDGELFPLEDLDYSIHQHLWLPLFAGLTWIYTLLGAVGAWLLWRTRSVDARRWVTLAALLMFLRLGFFSTLENPEPRYVVELFPFLAVLGGIAISIAWTRLSDALASRSAVA